MRLRVTDSQGASDTASVAIDPENQPPQATIAQPSPTLTWKVGDTVNFSGTATDPNEGALTPDHLSWALVLKHCTTVDSCHTHPLRTWDGVASGSFMTVDHDYPSHLELTLIATDSVGATDTQTVRLDPRTVNLTFMTNRSGLKLAVGPDQQATPFTRTVIVGSTNSITGPTPQALGSTAFKFVSWSDGGARAHDVVAPATPATYVATYATSLSIYPTHVLFARNCRGHLILRYRNNFVSRIHVRNIRCRRARRIIKAPRIKPGWKCVSVDTPPTGPRGVIRCEKRSMLIRFWRWQI